MVRSGWLATLACGASSLVVAALGIILGMQASAAVPADGYHGKGGALIDFIDFTPRGTQPGLEFNLLGANQCTSCHGNSNGESHYPGSSWSGSMMANATRDPLFWAALDVANQDGLENGAEGIGDYCLRCHTPNGWYNGRVRKLADVTPINGQVGADEVVDGFQGCRLQGGFTNGDVSGNDYAGIGCQFCHRMQAEGPGGEPGFLENADLWLDDSECDADGDGFGDGEPCRAGPYDYPVVGGEGFDAPPHPWKHSPYHSDSAMCGNCHDVTTPMLEDGPFRTLIVDNGTPAGNDTQLPYPVERTFSEWRNSDFNTLVFRDGVETPDPVPGKQLATGATCQDCHMRQAQPEIEGDDVLACSFGPSRNGNLAVHEFVGGNTWIPGILKGEYSDLGRDAAFDRTIAWANEILSERSASIETSARLAPGGDALAVDVTVINRSGHKLPTGYGEGRRMWLAIDVRDASDTSVWRSGAWDPATGELAVDAQTRVYEIKQGIWNTATGTCETTDAQGREMFHFVLNNCIAKDNRIPPFGFTAAADPEMASYGHSYPVQSDGRSVNFDRAQYSVPLPQGAQGPFSVRASLHFQIASKDYIEFLRNEAVENAFAAENDLCGGGPGRPFTLGPQDKTRGQYMYDLWASPAYGRSPPVEMASAQVQVAP